MITKNALFNDFNFSMIRMEIRCPSCNSDAIICHGRIPAEVNFAGKLLSKPVPGGKMYECLDCYLHFRFPRLKKNQLDKLYANGALDEWSSPMENRPDWRLAINEINDKVSVGKRILDVGCFDGGFLSHLSEYERYGVEINPQARKMAQSKGIKLIGEDFSVLNKLAPEYDAVTSFDVIEHVEDPFAFIKSIESILKPGGLIVTSTGNTDALAWKLMGSRYWYCAIPEHISFINPRWFNRISKELGLVIDEIEFFSHSRCSLQEKLEQLGKNVVYKFAPQLAARLRSQGFGEKDVNRCPDLAYAPPSWISAKDHMMCIMAKTC